MVRRAAIGVPPRIKEDILENNGRTLKQFLQNIKERLDSIGTTTTSSGGTTVVSGGGGSSSNANTLDGYDSSAFAIKANNETITGAWTHTASVTASQFIETSDRKLKKHIKPLKKALEIVLGLAGVSYTRKDTKEKEIGFIAQDVKKILPELVVEQGGTLGVNYSRVVAVLVEAIKEQNQRIDDLELQITKLQRGN